MRKSILGATIAMALLTSGCAGNPTLTACNTYDSTLFSLAGFRKAGRLNAAQIAAVESARTVANPICEQPTPPSDPTSLATVQSAIDALAATQAGVK